MRVLVDFDYIEANYSDSLKNEINSYVDNGDIVIIWRTFQWVGNDNKLTTYYMTSTLNYLSDKGIKYSDFMFNGNEEFTILQPGLVADVYIPSRT
jgi:hypothetical protein